MLDELKKLEAQLIGKHNFIRGPDLKPEIAIVFRLIEQAEVMPERWKPKHKNCCEGCQYELEEIIRVALTNRDGLEDFIKMNWPKEYAAQTPAKQEA